MAVIIKIGKEANAKKVRLEMDLRKSVNGDLMIFDHGDIDIVLSPSKNKVVVFPKETMSDLVYGAQNRLFAHLRKRGIVVAESIQGGAFYGSLEGMLEESADPDASAAKLALINIHNFIEEERPYFEQTEAIVSMADDELLHPDKTHSTELGEVPQEVEQGSIRQGYVRDPYSLGYMYTVQGSAMSDMKMIMENWRQSTITEDIQTVGQLLQIIKTVKKDKALKAGGKLVAKLALPGVGDLADFISAGLDAADFGASLYGGDLSDKKPPAALQAMQIDPNVSKIVDDDIEKAFLNFLSDQLEKMDPNTSLKNINTTSMLQKFIASKFNNTTVKK